MGSGSGLCWDAVLPAPGFALGIATLDDALTRIEFLPPQAGQAARSALAREAVGQLGHYLSDAQHVFDLPLAAGGSAHQKAVWALMQDIPVGATLSYGEAAERLGSSARAVGAACGANPLPVVIPCHRIVGSGGWLGGFAHAREGFLPGIKRWLLAHEAAARPFELMPFRGGDRALS